MGGTPYNSLYGRISLAEVYDRKGKPVEGLTGAFMAVKKSRKRFGFVIHLYLKGTFTSSQRRYIKGSGVGPRGGGTSSYKTLLSTLLVGGGWGGGGSTEFIVLMLVFYFDPEK